MKRSLILLVSLFPAALMAQQVSVNVTLAASPAGSANVGSPITLTANAVAGKPTPLDIKRPMPEVWRYTFTAQRTWPCADASPTTIASKVSTKSVTWSPKGGMYNLAVTAEFGSTVPLGGNVKVPSGKGSASLNNYTVRPTSGGINYIGTSFSPDSGTAVAPASVGLTLSITNAPEFRWWRYTVYGLGPAQTKDHQGSSAYFAFNNLGAASYTPSISVDQVNQNDCSWEAAVTTHANPYNYVVKAQ